MRDREMNLLGQMSRLHWLMGRYFHHKHRQHGLMGDIHRGQGRILALLRLKPEVSQRELSQILDMRPQSLGELLAKLERSGYIVRTQSDEDHRVMNISLTEAGREVLSQSEQRTDTDDFFGILSEEEQDTFSDYLGRIIAALEQRFIDVGMETESDEPPFGDMHHQHPGGGKHQHRGFGPGPGFGPGRGFGPGPGFGPGRGFGPGFGGKDGHR